MEDPVPLASHGALPLLNSDRWLIGFWCKWVAMVGGVSRSFACTAPMYMVRSAVLCGDIWGVAPLVEMGPAWSGVLEMNCLNRFRLNGFRLNSLR